MLSPPMDRSPSPPFFPVQTIDDGRSLSPPPPQNKRKRKQPNETTESPQLQPLQLDFDTSVPSSPFALSPKLLPSMLTTFIYPDFPPGFTLDGIEEVKEPPLHDDEEEEVVEIGEVKTMLPPIIILPIKPTPSTFMNSSFIIRGGVVTRYATTPLSSLPSPDHTIFHRSAPPSTILPVLSVPSTPPPPPLETSLVDVLSWCARQVTMDIQSQVYPEIVRIAHAVFHNVITHELARTQPAAALAAACMDQAFWNLSMAEGIESVAYRCRLSINDITPLLHIVHHPTLSQPGALQPLPSLPPPPNAIPIQIE